MYSARFRQGRNHCVVLSRHHYWAPSHCHTATLRDQLVAATANPQHVQLHAQRGAFVGCFGMFVLKCSFGALDRRSLIIIMVICGSL
ncbi:hypothetical protein BC936DRAFT_148140 [Jimgerdemannia flammicorona]|uniref:Uncharacterized protein n=1 Tax=Jimgerdemannia flammicorona TaxID=994334 RepID=A0A433DKQ4_9FUNG|nr:hypothetical protein BC936DRAFT_148140 [Jimgerdemannia flammicorona]